MEGVRKRALNFTPKEEDILLRLVKKYSQLIESKKSDTNTVLTKSSAWDKVCSEFNMLSANQYRDVKVLRSKYENLKKRTKQKYAEEKKYLYGTGGGPAKTPPPPGNNDSLITEIIGSQLTGFSSEFDDDAEPSSMNCNEHDYAKEEEVLTIADDEYDDGNCFDVNMPSTNNSANEIKDWSKYTPEMLRTPTSAALNTNSSKGDWTGKRKRTDNLKSKIGLWASSKQHLVSTQEKSFLEEHALKLKHMEEKHVQHLAHEREKHAKFLQLQEEEHQLKMKILQLQYKNLQGTHSPI